MIVNRQRLDQQEFETHFVKKESIMIAQHMLVDRARIMLTEIRQKNVEDQTDYLQVGQLSLTDFWDFEIVKETISAYNIFGPKYKILGIQI